MEKQSKCILTDGNIVYFELANTPMNRFVSEGQSIVINGKLYRKDKIHSIIFGESYQSVTTIPDKFIIDNDAAYKALQYIDLAGLSNVWAITGNFLSFGFPSLKSIDLSPLEGCMNFGNSHVLDCLVSLETIDISKLHQGLTQAGKLLNLGNNCTKLTKIKIGSLHVETTNGGLFNAIPNKINCIIYADTLEIGEEFKKQSSSLSNWTIHHKVAPKRDWIKKIFKSFDFKGNRIYNVRVNDPLIGENPVNKQTLIRTTTYDTIRAQRFLKPFNFPWLTKNLYGLRIKKVLDEILFPIIPYKYTNPELTIIDFLTNISNNAYNNLIDLGNQEPNGAKPKHQLFYNTNNFGFKLRFEINKHERELVSEARVVIYDGNTIVGNFGATNNNDSGIINVSNQVFKPGYKIMFEKQYNASVICNDTHNEPSPEDGFTNIGYKYERDITAEFYNRFFLLESPIIRLKTGADGLATDVASGPTPPAGFSYNYSYAVNAGSECLFDILIPTGLPSILKVYPMIYNMEINIRVAAGGSDKILSTVKLGDLYKQLNCSTNNYNINGVSYSLGYINLGVFETQHVRIDFVLKPY